MIENPNQLEVKNLEFDLGDFFNNATTAFYKYLDGDKGSFLQTIVGAIKNRPISQRAFDLIYRSLLRATTSVIKVNHQEQLDKIKGFCIKRSDFKFDLHLMIEFEIGKDFFDAPQELPLLKQVAPRYAKWLESLGFSPTVAELLSMELKNHFHLEIIKEWREEKAYYKDILTHFEDNPFYQSWLDKEKQLSYYAQLKTLYFQPALGHDSLKLADLYVAPYFRVHQNSIREDQKSQQKNQDGFVILNPRNRQSLHGYINKVLVDDRRATLNIEGEKSRLLLLLGQPGQGKTSFCAKLCHDLLHQPKFDKRLFLVKLRDLPNAKDFINQPLIELEKFLERRLPLNLSNTILILDGLDELYISDGLSNSDIKDVFERLHKLVEQKLGLYLILTTRYNYLNLKTISYKKALILQLDKLTQEQQGEWLDKFCQKESSHFTKETLAAINKQENENYASIRELISQPILLQMVVQSGIKIDAANNRAAIYNQLFDLMIERKWEKNQLAKFEQLDQAEFRAYLGVLALKIYQSDYEYISHHDIKELAETTIFLATIEKQSLDDALKDVLVSFYFKNKTKHEEDEDQNDRNGYALEFYHKSLQEYLAAERIYTFIKEEFTEKKSKKKTYVIDKWEDALKTVFDLVHASSLSEQLVAYLVEIIENDEENDRKIELAQRLTHFLPDLLQRHFMYEFTNATAVKPLNTASIVFYTYWMILSYCQKGLAERRKMVRPSDKMDFCRLLRLPHRSKYYQMDLSGLDLSGSQLSGVMLAGVKMFYLDLEMTNLRGADITRANLSAANLQWADLQGADLQGTYLKGAYLYKADLQGADLRGAALHGANLQGTDLRGAYLRGAYLQGADLQGVDLRWAHLQWAYLRKAILLGADLRGANLRGAYFYSADLRGADLRGADLQRANLQGADLQGTDLAEVSLHGVLDLTATQLMAVKTLFDSKLDKTIEEELREKGFGNLFERPDYMIDENEN